MGGYLLGITILLLRLSRLPPIMQGDLLPWRGHENVNVHHDHDPHESNPLVNEVTSPAAKSPSTHPNSTIQSQSPPTLPNKLNVRKLPALSACGLWGCT